MAREPIPTWCFALAVVRKGDRFLIVHERKHGERWYLPAGRVEPGETFADAAIRETLEEAGIAIRIDGILRVEHTPTDDGARMRAVFVARPTDDRPPKHTPDDDSLGAAWVTLAELAHYPLRGDEVRELFAHVQAGARIYPPELLTYEGAPYDRD
jgi:8-oxo-dGTP pyrophosphatase MutT (NUDIX family)